MAAEVSSILGLGIYSVPDAARLTGVSAGRIRRWLLGYRYRVGDETRASPPVWQPQLPEIEGALALSFRDLMEVRVIDSLRRHGVSWPSIRSAAERATRIYRTTHPFSTERFRTDGRSVFGYLAQRSRESALIDLASGALVFKNVVSPYLQDLDFGKSGPERWWPMGRRSMVVVDPERSFGTPIVRREGVPTSVLANAVRVEESVDRVARWFSADRRSVVDAVRFEERFVAA